MQSRVTDVQRRSHVDWQAASNDIRLSPQGPREQQPGRLGLKVLSVLDDTASKIELPGGLGQL